MLPEFKAFSKIPRLNRDVIITEKIDGTNSGILVTDDRQLHAASRSRWITPGKDDNFGFAGWMKKNEDELRELGPGMHWGEWWGTGIQRRYGLDHKRFSLFNTSRWLQTDSDYMIPDGVACAAPDCCHVVPIIEAGNFSKFDFRTILVHLENHGSYAALGFEKPEGIIIFHVAANSYFKATIEKDEEWKGKS